MDTIPGRGGFKVTKNVVGSRPSDHITRKVTQSILRAFDFAAELGRPLNVYVVVHLRETSSASAATIFDRLRHKFRDWLTYKRQKAGNTVPPPAYAYTMENPTGSPHVNWVLHVPVAFRKEFERKLPVWVSKLQDVNVSDIDIQSVNEDTAKSLAKYIVKGTDEEFVEHFYLTAVYAPQGRIHGKRAGTSPSIGKARRDAVGFRPRRRRSNWVSAGRPQKPVGRPAIRSQENPIPTTRTTPTPSRRRASSPPQNLAPSPAEP